MNFLLTKKGVSFILTLLILLGGGLRLIHFPSLLHFELDQARDARIIDGAFQGNVSDLPLLGPRAGGTSFRLPPVFYYLEYGSALLFGDTPAGMAFFIPLLSTGAILFFFFLMWRYFSMGISLGLSALFAFSPFFVLYGRFAWNPNPLPFFLLLGSWSLLKAVDTTEKRPSLWFLIATLSLGIASALHSLAFVGIPALVFFFLLWKRPRFSWKIWLSVVAIIAILFLPVVLNEIETGGQNSREFLKAVSGKSTKNDHSLLAKTAKNVLEQTVWGVAMVSGYEHAELPSFKTAPRDIICGEKCRVGLPYGTLALFLFATAFLFFVLRVWKTEKGKEKDFLVLSFLWFFLFFIMLMPIAYDYAPRFFLLLTPLPFLFLGILAQEFQAFFPQSKGVKVLLLLFLMALIISNVFFTGRRLEALAEAPTTPVPVLGADRILNDKARVTLEEQNLIVGHMEKRLRETGYPIFMYSEPQHRRALKYLLEKRGLQNAVLDVDGIYREGVYFLIIRSLSNLDNGIAKYREKYDEIDREQFGTLTLFEFRPKADLDILEKKDFTPLPPTPPETSRFAPRYTWREWWTRQGAMPEDDTLDENDATDNQ